MNAIVVDTSWPPEPLHISANADGSGSDSARRTRVVRFGIEPSSARRRSIMYWYSTESSDGLKYGGLSASIELSGISSCMYSRSRRSTICCLVIFLIWCVELRPSKPSPSVHPLTVLAEDDRRRARSEVLGRCLVRGVQLAVVVAAAREVAQLVVGEVGDHLAETLVGAEEVVADVAAVLDGVALELAVDGGVHLVEQRRRPCPGRAAGPTSSPRRP